MKLMEMFSPLGGPKEKQSDIDWLDDLKFYIDNNDDMLQRYIFPAVEIHKKYIDHPKAFQIYIKPIKRCCDNYCKEFYVKDKQNKFTNEKLIELAKHVAENQKTFIERGDYDFSNT